MSITSGILAIDNGGYSTCVVTSDSLNSFPSVKGLFGDRTLTNISSEYDYIVEYRGEKYVMGTLAKYDCKYPLQMHTDTKQNLFFDLSILVAIHQFGYNTNHIIISVPIDMHNDDEKNGLINRLLGSHEIMVNDYRKKFVIKDIKIAPESAVAFWIEEPYGKNRFIDLGSRTIGYATTINEGNINRFIDSESGTFKGKGIEALDSSYNQKALSDYICGRLISMWDKHDNVHLLGGGALDGILVNHIREYFPNLKVLSNPLMANAMGMYNLGRLVYST